MRHFKVYKKGWSWAAFAAGPFWYLYHGMVGKGLVMLCIILATLGIGIIPVWIYCGIKGNKDFYTFLKEKGIYINVTRGRFF